MSRDEAIKFYGSQSPEVKSEIWLDKIDQTFTFGWDDKQRAHLEELRLHITSDFFKDDITSFEKFRGYTNDWRTRGSSFFNKADLKVILTQLNDFRQEQFSLNSAARLATLGCECKRSDDWCVGTTTTCKMSSCYMSSWGCGWLWNYNCNGNCVNEQQST